MLLAAIVLGSREDGKVHLVANFDTSVAERVSASDRSWSRRDRRRRRRRPIDHGRAGAGIPRSFQRLWPRPSA
jgi:hypothetical protein